MNEAVGFLKEKVESLFGISHGRFALFYEYSDKNGKDPYGFGARIDLNEDSTMPSPYGGMYPWQRRSRQLHDADYEPAYRWAYLTVKFPNEEEPVRLRPEQIADLLKQRSHQELAILFQANISEESMSRSAYLLKQMEYAYCLKKYKNGDLKLMPIRLPH